MLLHTSSIRTGNCSTPTTQTEPYYTHVRNLRDSNNKDLQPSINCEMEPYPGSIEFGDLTLPELTESTNYQNLPMVNDTQEIENSILNTTNTFTHAVDQPTPTLHGNDKRVTKARNLTQEFDSVLGGVNQLNTRVDGKNKRVARGRNLTQVFVSALDGVNRPTRKLCRKRDKVTEGRILSQKFDSVLDGVDQSTPIVYGKDKKATEVRNLTQEYDSVLDGVDQLTIKANGVGKRTQRMPNLTQEFDSILDGQSHITYESISWITPEKVSTLSHRKSMPPSMQNHESPFTNSPYTSSKQPDKSVDNSMNTSKHNSVIIPSNRKIHLKHFKTKRFAPSTPILKSFIAGDDDLSCSIISQRSQIEVRNSSTQTDTEDISNIVGSSRSSVDKENFIKVENKNTATITGEFSLKEFIATLAKADSNKRDTERIRAFNNTRNNVKKYFNFNDYCKRIYNLKEQFDKDK